MTSGCSPRSWRIPQRRSWARKNIPQLALKAAALLDSLARFHPLIDCNKRTAWTLRALLLWINGYRHDFNTEEGFDLVVGVAAGGIDLQRSAILIEQHLIRP